MIKKIKNAIFSSAEFSKQIVIWAMVVSTIYIFAVEIAYYKFKIEPPDNINGLIQTIITGVIISYAVKSGAENVTKIRTKNKDSEVSVETVSATDSTSESV